MEDRWNYEIVPDRRIVSLSFSNALNAEEENDVKYFSFEMEGYCEF